MLKYSHFMTRGNIHIECAAYRERTVCRGTIINTDRVDTDYQIVVDHVTVYADTEEQAMSRIGGKL